MRSWMKALAGAVAVAMVAVAAAIAWPAPSAPLPDPRRAYLIDGVRVVDVAAGRAGPPVAVVVRDGRIASIGSAPAGGGLVRVDGRGRFLVPGFWDMHMHSFQLSPQLHLPLYVANGITSVRDMMDCPQVRDSLIACAADKRGWSAAGATGRMASPRYVEVASYYFENPGLTRAEIAARAGRYATRELGALKVYNRLSAPAYAQVAHEARRRGLRLVGHLPKAVALDDALAAGQTSFEHAHLFPRHCFRGAADWRAGRLDALPPTRLAELIVAEHDPSACEAAFASMKVRGAWYVPTHVTREEDARAGDPSFTEDPRLAYLDPLSRWAYRDDLGGTRRAYPRAAGERALEAYFEHGLRLTGAAHRAGVRVLVGTDTAIGGFRYHDELGHLVRAGLTPADVLRAATIEAARYAGLEASSGSIETGKRADLVLLDADPLADVGNTRRIHAVWLNGRLYDRAALDRLLAFSRDQAASPANWLKLLWGFARSSVTADL